MSDDDPSYYKAWCDVFGRPMKKLLCTWHVGKSVQKQLSKKGCNTLKQKSLMANLYKLKSVKTITKFKKLAGP